MPIIIACHEVQPVSCGIVAQNKIIADTELQPNQTNYFDFQSNSNLWQSSFQMPCKLDHLTCLLMIVVDCRIKMNISYQSTLFITYFDEVLIYIQPCCELCR